MSAGPGRVRVGLDLLFHGPRAAGVGTYARELGAALAARDDVELHVFLARDAPPELRDARWLTAARVTRLPVSNDARPRQLALASFGVLPALALARRLDVLHGPASGGAVGVPGLACVVTLHDVIYRQAATDWSTPAAIAVTDRAARRTARWATLVLCVSQAAAADIGRELGTDSARIAVARSGVRPRGIARSPAGSPLILSVGQKRRYKDHLLLLEALARLRRDDVRLVLPGAGELDNELRARAEQLGLGARVELPGWVGEQELERLYATATCVVQPSRFEGFGLPLLEAFSAGAPVACSAIPAHLEVAGDAALTFAPGDVAGCAGAIDALLSDPELRERLVAAGRARAAESTWERCAAETVTAYRRARGLA